MGRTPEQRLEELKALGFDSEADYQKHHRVLQRSRGLAAKQITDSIAAGSTCFDHRKMTMDERVRSPAVERFNAKCRFERKRAEQLGLEIQPSVSGPYLVVASSNEVKASPQSAAYHAALYAGQAMPKPWRA